MPCGAPAFYFTWLVEWLHRRVISSTGAIVRRKAVVRSMRFRTLTMIFVTINDVFWKSLQFVWSARAWISFSESITAGRCETRKLYVAKQPFPWTGNLEIMIFSKILTLVKGSGLKAAAAAAPDWNHPSDFFHFFWYYFFWLLLLTHQRLYINILLALVVLLYTLFFVNAVRTFMLMFETRKRNVIFYKRKHEKT